MIRVVNFFLILVSLLFVIGAIADETAVTPNSTIAEEDAGTMDEDASVMCRSVCGETDDGEPITLSNPDFIVEYQWNSRVPTCAGKSCQAGPCSEMELKLSSFQTDEDACKEHQAGLKWAGCECSSGGRRILFASSPFWIASTLIVGILNFFF
mmetsp:Transcript_17824/g.41124  ORF Transcript_17824/g.41124 Transcript_17824/m.41124 type:complete len:153 (+) Transcript_17824:172-630(+)